MLPITTYAVYRIGEVVNPFHVYWPIREDVFAPYEWNDLPDGVREEWINQIPAQDESVTLGGVTYTLVEDILLPAGQRYYAVMTTKDLTAYEASVWV